MTPVDCPEVVRRRLEQSGHGPDRVHGVPPRVPTSALGSLSGARTRRRWLRRADDRGSARSPQTGISVGGDATGTSACTPGLGTAVRALTTGEPAARRAAGRRRDHLARQPRDQRRRQPHRRRPRPRPGKPSPSSTPAAAPPALRRSCWSPPAQPTGRSGSSSQPRRRDQRPRGSSRLPSCLAATRPVAVSDRAPWAGTRRRQSRCRGRAARSQSRWFPVAARAGCQLGRRRSRRRQRH